MFRKTFALLGVLKILVLSTPVMASEAPAEKFYVYGKTCKSVRLQGTFDSIQKACEAAGKYRRDGMTDVSVRTGAHDTRDENGATAASFRVYRRGARCGIWSLNSTVDSADKAKETGDKLQTPLSPVEIVLHYGKFAVHGGNCSRSVRLQGTYDTVESAFAASQKFRDSGLKLVSVHTGPGDHFGTAATQYQVYRRACKGSWSLHTTVANANGANKICEQLKKSSPRVEVEIVLHRTAQ